MLVCTLLSHRFAVASLRPGAHVCMNHTTRSHVPPQFQRRPAGIPSATVLSARQGERSPRPATSPPIFTLTHNAPGSGQDHLKHAAHGY